MDSLCSLSHGFFVLRCFSLLKCLKIVKALEKVFLWQGGELEALGCGKSRKWREQGFVGMQPRRGSLTHK